MRRFPLSRSAGFTIIEVAIVLTILGLIIAYLLPPFGKQVTRAKTKSVEQIVAQARDEIINLGLMNASCILPEPGTDNTVPEGLTNRLDPWGNSLYYIVDPRFTESAGVCYICGTDINATKGGNDMTDVAFIVGSRGKNHTRDVLKTDPQGYEILNQGEKVGATGRVFDDVVEVLSLPYLASVRGEQNGPLDCEGTELCLPFLENADDVSGNGHDNGTEAEYTLGEDRFGCVNASASFNGAGGIDYGNGTRLNAGTGDVSLVAWVGNATVSGKIAGKGEFSSMMNGYALNATVISGADIRFVFEIGNGTSSVLVTAGEDGQFTDSERWYFVVAVADRDASEGLRLYIDGKIQNSTDPTSLEDVDITNGKDFIVGGFPDFKGHIDDVRLYKRALGAQEILTIYQNERP